MTAIGSAEEYRAARAAFLARCAAHGIDPVAYRHPLPGPDGEAIFSDVVRLGPAQAARLLVVCSGTHGLEAYAGSGAQCALLDDLAAGALPADTAVVLLHMVNPWGAAWRRRHNEDNVDLNRHFVDRSQPLPANPSHALLVAEGVFEAFAGPEPDAALAALEAFRARHGDRVHAQAVFQGQYDRPDGLGFGGTVASWSRELIARVVADHGGAPATVALIDLHTGLGPFGIGTLISTEPPGSPTTALLRGWYDDPFVAILEEQDDLPYKLQGDLANAWREEFADSRLLPISLEFGTYPSPRFAELMIADAWAERQADKTVPAIEAIRCDLVHFFYPRSAAWRAMVAERTRSVAAMALAGLAGIDAS